MTHDDDARKAAWDADWQAGRNGDALVLALTVTGRLDAANGAVLCPGCGKPAPIGKKFKMFPDGGWKHFSSQGCHGSAHDVLISAGHTKGDARNFLAGKTTRAKIERPEHLPEISIAKFEATVDLEVFHGVLVYGRKTGGVQAAQEFYGQWHISPDVVEESRAVMITDPEHFESSILARYGAERLVGCGLFVETARGPRSIISANFPVVEPHLHAGSGYPVYMQFRASTAQHQRYLAHKAGTRPYEGSEKFLSLRGAPASSQIGIGLERIAKLAAGTTVYVIEGMKDVLAARTLGTEAYGVPGVDSRPSKSVLEVLSRMDNVVTLDGDEAGAAHRDRMAEYLNSHGAPARTYALTGGMDIADRLVAKHAAAGCRCPACTQMLANLVPISA